MAYRISAVVEDFDEGQAKSVAPRAMGWMPLGAVIKMIPEKAAIREMNAALSEARIEARVCSFSVGILDDGRMECAIGYEGEDFFHYENNVRDLIDGYMKQHGLSGKITFRPY